MKKTVKRFISLLAVFALACTMLTAVHADGPQFEVIIDSASSVVEPGDTFAVTVKLNNLNTVRAGDILGTVSSPTKYSLALGEHLSFAVLEDSTAIDPKVALAQ